jgi:hypothetical protein
MAFKECPQILRDCMQNSAYIPREQFPLRDDSRVIRKRTHDPHFERTTEISIFICYFFALSSTSKNLYIK